MCIIYIHSIIYTIIYYLYTIYKIWKEQYKMLLEYLCFGYDPSHEGRCGIFYLGHHINTQESFRSEGLGRLLSRQHACCANMRTWAHIKDWAGEHVPVILGLGSGGKRTMRGSLASKPEQWVSSSFGGRPCLKSEGGERERKMLSSLHVCMHRHTYLQIYVQTPHTQVYMWTHIWIIPNFRFHSIFIFRLVMLKLQKTMLTLFNMEKHTGQERTF